MGDNKALISLLPSFHIDVMEMNPVRKDPNGEQLSSGARQVRALDRCNIWIVTNLLGECLYGVNGC